ncbi:MAG: TraK family protein [Anaerolineales bacterium]|nr:TraK family protein [Anaerolineales bacterium]
MAKSLSERIAARTVKKKPSRSAQNRAAFLALRVDIKQALDDGWPVKSIWETLHEEGKVDFSYQAFRGYVNRLILSPPATDHPSPAAEKLPATGSSNPTKQVAPKATVKQPEKATGFTFNSEPKKEDLI